MKRDPTVFYCAHPHCPGYRYRASEIAHPRSTCTTEGRRRAQGRARRLWLVGRYLLAMLFAATLLSVVLWADPGCIAR